MKTILESKIGESGSDQTLVYAGKYLENYKTLASYDIMEESMLDIFLVKFQITVQASSGTTETLSVERSFTIKVIGILQKFKMSNS